MDVDELDGEGILERDRYPEGGSEEDVVGAPDERGEVGGKGLAGFRTAMEGGEGVKLAARDDAVAGDCGAVFDRTGAEVDPEVAISGGEEGAGALGDGRGGIAGGVGVGVGFGIGEGREVKEVEVDVIRVRIRVLFAEVVLDDGVDGGVGDGEERGAERGRDGVNGGG